MDVSAIDWLGTIGPSGLLVIVVIMLLRGKLTTDKQCADKIALIQKQVDLMKELNAPTAEAHPFRRKTDPEPPEHPYRRRDDPEELRHLDEQRRKRVDGEED